MSKLRFEAPVLLGIVAFDQSRKTAKIYVEDDDPPLKFRGKPGMPRFIRFAERKKATPAQIALAWLLAQRPWIVPIPGTTKLHRLEENIGAANVKLSPEDLRELDAAASKVPVQGARYPEELQRLVGR